jgi:hypothetical protein
VARLSEEMTFVSHPLLKLHTVFYLQPRREVVFVKEMVGAAASSPLAAASTYRSSTMPP